MSATTQSNRLVDEDAEANQFAIELLMPESFVRREVAKLGGIDLTEDAQVIALARIFKVNTVMMAYRLGQIYPTIKGTP